MIARVVTHSDVIELQCLAPDITGINNVLHFSWMRGNGNCVYGGVSGELQYYQVLSTGQCRSARRSALLQNLAGGCAQHHLGLLQLDGRQAARRAGWRSVDLRV